MVNEKIILKKSGSTQKGLCQDAKVTPEDADKAAQDLNDFDQKKGENKGSSNQEICSSASYYLCISQTKKDSKRN